MESTQGEEQKKSTEKKARWPLFLGIGVGSVVLLVGGFVGAAFAVSSSAMAKEYDYQPVPLQVKPDTAMVERGEAVATYRGCRDCHGMDLSGRLVADAMPVMVLSGPNITPGGLGKDYSDEDLARLLRHGVKRDKKPVLFMPSYEYSRLSHEDMAALIAYIRSVPAKDTKPGGFEVGPLGRILYMMGQLPLLPVELIDHDAKPMDVAPSADANYGEYLVSACVGCHGPGLSGGKIPGVPPEWPAAANLTPHETGLKSWKFEDFQTALRTGKRPDGSEIDGNFMPWKMAGQSSDDDLKALWAYIQTMPAKPKGGR